MAECQHERMRQLPVNLTAQPPQPCTVRTVSYTSMFNVPMNASPFILHPASSSATSFHPPTPSACHRPTPPAETTACLRPQPFLLLLPPGLATRSILPQAYPMQLAVTLLRRGSSEGSLKERI